MNIFNCQHPVEITLHGVKRKVPCGTCVYCRAVRAQNMAQRITNDIKASPFGVFFTLTYDDASLPSMHYDHYQRAFVLHDTVSSDSGGLVVPFPYLSEDSQRVINTYNNLLGFVPRLDKRSIQLFIKRVRKHIYTHFVFPNIKDFNDNLLIKNEKEKYNLRYAICGEYGPTTFRPHYHGVFLFKSPEIAKSFCDILRACWPYGIVDARYLTSTDNGNYVARYVNGIYSLPEFYRLREFRPFLLVSKKTPVGLSNVDSERVRESFNRRSATIDCFDVKRGRFIPFPLPLSIENYLYPRYTGFNYSDDRERLSLIEFASRFKSLIFMQDYCLRNLNIPKYIKDWLSCVYKSRSSELVSSFKDRVYCSAIKSLYYCSKHIVRNMHKFGVDSIRDYLDIINEYLFNKDMYRLSEQLRLEQKLPGRLLPYIDIDIHDSSLFEDPLVVNELNIIFSCIAKSKKNKVKGDYLMNHREYLLFH